MRNTLITLAVTAVAGGIVAKLADGRFFRGAFAGASMGAAVMLVGLVSDRRLLLARQ